MRNINENVKLIRESKGVSKTFIAKRLNLSLQGYIHIENGNVTLSADRLKIISETLGVDVGIFFDEQLTDNVTNCV